ncbi:imidazole glycerol phosphate synthase subunit HisH [Buchnera aphidicola (Mollitrichosiphum nigrofasciatum)]|uniref:imidazole glycerol phosphate synthase subunit HisH n=1 Tax=Buchnera aphidicola TaxID=9 RepID=UPI0031B860BC
MDIIILDTGCANLSSVKFAIKRLGYNPIITNEYKTVLHAEKIILPGVGTPFAAMSNLKKYKLIDIILNYTKPILGICLGMQLFCAYSEESKNIKNLNIIKYPILSLPKNNLPLPHIGWNKVYSCKKNVLFRNIMDGSRFYFLHQYMLPINKYSILKTDYGCFFSAAFQKKNFFGIQFHPEKSGPLGSQLLKNFLEI